MLWFIFASFSIDRSCMLSSCVQFIISFESCNEKKTNYSDASILGFQFRYDNDTILTNYRDIDIELDLSIIRFIDSSLKWTNSFEVSTIMWLLCGRGQFFRCVFRNNSSPIRRTQISSADLRSTTKRIHRTQWNFGTLSPLGVGACL